MSVVTYNGVILPYAFITDFRQEAVYDDVGNTDWYCTKFDIRVQCILNFNYLALIAPDLIVGGAPSTDNASIIMKAIRERLLDTRRTLSVVFNNHELIPQATAGDGTVDVRNGPMPQSCICTQLTNITFLVQYHIIAHYWENNRVNPLANPIVQARLGNKVLFNRWTETVDMDNCQYTKRTREGKFAIRSDNVEGKIADQVRSAMAIVSVPDGFLRESSSYTVTPDGLAIQYRIIDQEVFKKPPPPAFVATGHYYESLSQNKAVRHGEVRVHLKGDKVSSQPELITTAVAIATSKLHIRGSRLLAGGFSKPFSILEHGGVRIGLYDNEVEVVLRAMVANSPKRKDQIAAFNHIDTFTPLTDGGINYTPPYQDRGTASYLLRAAAYYDPSLRTTVLSTKDNASDDNPLTSLGTSRNQLSQGLEVGRAGIEVES